MSDKKLRKGCIVLILFVLCWVSSQAQFSHNVRGASVGYYEQKIGRFDLEKDYLYRAMILDISQKKKVAALSFLALTFDFHTQLGITHVSDDRNPEFVEKGIETAILLGLNLEFSLFPQYWWLYVGGSIGPQFISNSPSRQNKGFIFSDNIYAGTRLNISNGKQLNLQVGFRHQSNAGFSEPNGGINSLFASFGVFTALEN